MAKFARRCWNSRKAKMAKFVRRYWNSRAAKLAGNLTGVVVNTPRSPKMPQDGQPANIEIQTRLAP